MNEDKEGTSSKLSKSIYKKIIGVSAKRVLQIIEAGLDVLVPLSIVIIGVIALFPGSTFHTTVLEPFVDFSSGKLYILPILLFCVSLSLKLFTAARRFPAGHLAYFIGFGAGVAGLILLVLIVITERVDAFWISALLVIVWLFLRLAADKPESASAFLRKQWYALAVVVLLLAALNFPVMFGVNYELKSRMAQEVVEALNNVKWPDNHPCFRTYTRVNVALWGFTHFFTEEFDDQCSTAELAIILVKHGLSNGNAELAATGLAVLSAMYETHEVAQKAVADALLNMTRTGEEFCFQDELHRFCMRPIKTDPPGN